MRKEDWHFASLHNFLAISIFAKDFGFHHVCLWNLQLFEMHSHEVPLNILWAVASCTEHGKPLDILPLATAVCSRFRNFLQSWP